MPPLVRAFTVIFQIIIFPLRYRSPTRRIDATGVQSLRSSRG
ncbi:MAG: hypothetical protein OJF47_000468 [Nitrospira sp.]|nr:MAG: hypothetical protein OJF47_000468 [Nitrospira sp.]